MTFQSESAAPPDLGTFLVEAKLAHLWALVTTIPGSLKRIQEILTETGKLESEKRVHWKYGTLEVGLQRMLRSVVAPTRVASGFAKRIARLLLTYPGLTQRRLRRSMCRFSSGPKG